MALKVLGRRVQKMPPKSTEKTNASQLSSENIVRNFIAFDLIDNDVSLLPVV